MGERGYYNRKNLRLPWNLHLNNPFEDLRLLEISWPPEAGEPGWAGGRGLETHRRPLGAQQAPQAGPPLPLPSFGLAQAR